MNPYVAKFVKPFECRVTDQASFILPSPLGLVPVVTNIAVSADAAGRLAVQIGGTRATLAVDPTGSNNEFTVRSLRGGDSGEGISLEIVENGNSTALSVATTVNATPATGGYDVDIVVNVETDSGGNGISTAREVIDAINDDNTAGKYIEAYPTTSEATVAGAIAVDVASAPLASGSPTERFAKEFEAAFAFSETFEPGVLMGTYAGDDVRIVVSAGTDRELYVAGFYIPGVLQSEPVGFARPRSAYL